MEAISAILGIGLVVAAVWDGIETLVLPRTVDRRVSITTVYYGICWGFVRACAKRIRNHSLQQRLLSAYSPLSLLILIAFWAVLIVFGYALIFYGLRVPFTGGVLPSFGQLLYASGVTFFTLGYGDLTPISPTGHAIAVLEAANGFGFLGLLIGFVPVLYGSFSRREATILLLDARAGSEPTAFEVIRRHSEADAWPELIQLLKTWEELAASLLENYISFPVLAYYRSQHLDQSWLRAITTMLDTCALIESSLELDHPHAKSLRFQARNTFAMGRHLLVDVSYILGATPDPNLPSRLADKDSVPMRHRLQQYGAPLRTCIDSEEQFAGIRREYEPFSQALADEILLELSPWFPDHEKPDNWQISAWDGVPHFSN
jgi:hypothetical protein